MYEVKSSTFSLTYEAIFKTPFFRIADARPAVIETLFRAFADYGISPTDMYGFSGVALSDQRARINLFKGNAYLEVRAEKVYATFNNAVGPKDLEIVENCIKRLLSAMESYAADAPLGTEQSATHIFHTEASHLCERQPCDGLAELQH